MLANVQVLMPNRLIEPHLKEVIEKVALAKPNLLFVHDKKVDMFYSTRTFDNASRQAPDGKVWVTKFRVLDNGAPAGFIHIDTNYSRSSNERWRIGVRSHLIEKDGRRGERSTTFSSNVAKIVSNAKKYLVGQTYGYMLYDKLRSAISTANHSIHSLTSSIRHGQFLTSTVDAQVLLHEYLTSRPVSTALESAMRAKLDTPKFESALAEYKLARWFEEVFNKKACKFIHRHEDGYMFYTDEHPEHESNSHNAAVTVTQFEDFPHEVQNKLAVLQLMSDKEIVKDVGQRVDSGTFWVAM